MSRVGIDPRFNRAIMWAATAPAREVEKVARGGLVGEWSGTMKRKDALDYILRALSATEPLYQPDDRRHQTIRAELAKRGLLDDELVRITRDPS